MTLERTPGQLPFVRRTGRVQSRLDRRAHLSVLPLGHRPNRPRLAGPWQGRRDRRIGIAAEAGIKRSVQRRAIRTHRACGSFVTRLGGCWDEWYATFSNGWVGWLAEAQGHFYLTFYQPFRQGTTLPSYDELQVGQTVNEIATDASHGARERCRDICRRGR